MDMEKFIDALSETSRLERGRYHITLGQLIKLLEAANPDAVVQFDDGSYPDKGMSYRGYYSDLAFDSCREPKTVRAFLEECRSLLGSVQEGYKGGDYTMTEGTPLWCAEYGCCGKAVVSYVASDDRIVLVLKNVD